PAAVVISTQFQGKAALGDIEATSLSVTSVNSGISIALGAFISANSITFNSPQTITVNAGATLLSAGLVKMTSTGDFSIGHNANIFSLGNGLSLTSSGGTLAIGGRAEGDAVAAPMALAGASVARDQRAAP